MIARIADVFKPRRRPASEAAFPIYDAFDLAAIRSLFSSSAVKSVASGNWSSPDTWGKSGVPNTGEEEVFISSGHSVVIDTNASIRSIIIQPNASLKFLSGMDTFTLKFAEGGMLNNKGTFTQGRGILAFNGSGTILGTIIATSDITGGPVTLGKTSEVYVYKSITVGELIIKSGFLHIMNGTTLTASSITLERDGYLF